MFTSNDKEPHAEKKWMQLLPMKWNGYDMLLAIIFSFTAVLMTRVRFSGAVNGTAQENYFSKFGISAVALFFLLLAVFYLVIPFLDSILHRYLRTLCSYTEKEANPAKELKFWGILITVAWLPYYLSYYPGGICSDTFSSITYCLTETLCNRHPVFYNFLIGLAIKFGNLSGQDLEWSMGFFLAAQMILLELELIFFLYWMIVHRIHHKMRICIMTFMVFFPLIPLYAVSVWKDTPFSMAFMLWFMFAIDLYLNIKNNKWHLKTLVGFVIGMFLVAFTRNNGVYVVAFVAVMFILLTFTYRFGKKFLIHGTILLSAMAIAFIQGPVYRHAGVIPTDVVEDIGIPIQQICSVVVYDGNITDAQKESIDRFIPYDNIPEYFMPCVVDSIKWAAGMDWGYLYLNKPEFWNLWIHLLVQNPQIYIQEYLLETLGFWNVNVSGPGGYVQTKVDGNSYGLEQTDYFQSVFGFSFQSIVTPRHYISSAWFFWIF